jgi:hypothetical protein
MIDFSIVGKFGQLARQLLLDERLPFNRCDGYLRRVVRILDNN